ncbi:MAG: hypothetical protein N3D75_04300 [Candidatus Aenigmarchaeota archaeon]|nr:hypothetical protein [Candidatus Aenigmarchaeota archaeon]
MMDTDYLQQILDFIKSESIHPNNLMHLSNILIGNYPFIQAVVYKSGIYVLYLGPDMLHLKQFYPYPGNEIQADYQINGCLIKIGILYDGWDNCLKSKYRIIPNNEDKIK